jgi:hypothetical protein
MDALFDRSGNVVAWYDRPHGDILDLTGSHIAFVDGDSVYNYSGSHIGWWQSDHIRDSSGSVSTFTKNASGLGVYRPYLAYEPYQPYKAFRPFRPFKSFKPFKPYLSSSWSSQNLFS